MRGIQRTLRQLCEKLLLNPTQYSDQSGIVFTPARLTLPGSAAEFQGAAQADKDGIVAPLYSLFIADPVGGTQ